MVNDTSARARDTAFFFIGEVNHRDTKFSVKEAEAFVDKAQALMRLEQVETVVLFACFRVSSGQRTSLYGLCRWIRCLLLFSLWFGELPFTQILAADARSVQRKEDDAGVFHRSVKTT